MLIEKLRCESICLPGSHYAALTVKITPEENFQRVALVLSFSHFLSRSFPFFILFLYFCCDDIIHSCAPLNVYSDVDTNK